MQNICRNISVVVFFLTLTTLNAQEVTNVFQMKDFQPLHNALRANLGGLIQNQNYIEMEKLCLKAVEAFPNDANWYYNLACAQARIGKISEARKALTKSAELGFSDLKTLNEDADLAILRRDPAFVAVQKTIEGYLKNPESIPQRTIALDVADIAPITSSNTLWDVNAGLFRTVYSAGSPPETEQGTQIPGETGNAIRAWLKEGTASGNYGDIYDNHDRGHSVFDTKLFTGLVPTEYSSDAVAFGADTAFSLFTFPGRFAFGNSSTANIDPKYWSSCARMMQNRYSPQLLQQYLSNVIYTYPQHNDYRSSQFGDVFPSRTPYLFISPGSSWTDRPILASIAIASASLRPEVKGHLLKSGLLAPTMQYLLRASQTNLTSRQAYLTAEAHPVVFDGEKVDTLNLANLAHSITLSDLPPLAPITDKSIYSAGEGGAPALLNLFVTPFAVAKLWNSSRETVTVKLAVNKITADPNLTYHWFVGQGVKDKIKITKLSRDGSEVEIAISYHEPNFDTSFNIKSSRVDVICIADNGTHYSAPSFFSCYFRPDQIRKYKNGALLSVNPPATTNLYIDTMFNQSR